MASTKELEAGRPTRTDNPYLGVGLYTLADAARFLGVPRQTLRRWRESYTFDKGGISELLLGEESSELAHRGLLPLADLVELKLIRLFRNAGLSMREIRKVAERAAGEFGTHHPFATKRFKTVGKRIYAEMEEQQRAVRQPQRSHQQVPEKQVIFDEVAMPFFKHLDYAGDEVVKYWPLGKDRRVVLDARRAFGKPIDDEFGVPTLVLYSTYRAGESIESVTNWYEVSEEAVTAAIEYEQSLAA
jgi:uncharacterized protein (DUF433 family)/DNA-binding transcriptional MerR regulator